MHMLIIEPDKPLASFLQQSFQSQHYEVDLCTANSEAVQTSLAASYDAILLDLLLPGSADLALLKEVRLANPDAAIMVLSASDRVEDRVSALDLGADEYLAKPFSFLELSTRMRGLLRRQSGHAASTLQVGDLKLDRVQHTVSRAGRRIELTRREFALLEYLMRNAGCRVSRELILQHVWGVAGGITTNLIDVYVAYLRQKLHGAGLPELIHTVRGVGYEISSQPATANNSAHSFCQSA